MNPAERTAMQQTYFRKMMDKKELIIMNYYHLRDGLHSAEIRLLQRALKEHLQTATRHKADLIKDPGAKAFEVTQAKDAIDAMVRLSNRLRSELVAVPAKV